MKYLRKVETDAEVTASSEYSIVYYSEESDNVFFKKKELPYLCFTALEDDFQIRMTGYNGVKDGGPSGGIFYYTIDNGITWTKLGNSDSTRSVTKGTNIYIYGENTKDNWTTYWMYDTWYTHLYSYNNKKYKLSGNLMSLINKTCPTEVSISFYALFHDSSVVDINCQTTSFGGCMFKNSTSLLTITLPSTITSIDGQAFYGCQALASVTYNGTTYTSKSALTTALTSNGVTVGTDAFAHTALAD